MMCQIGISCKLLIPILCLVIGVSTNPIQQQQQNDSYPYAYPNYYETQPYPYAQPQGYPSYSDFPGAAAGARGPYDPTAYQSGAPVPSPQFDPSAYQPQQPIALPQTYQIQPDYGAPPSTFDQPQQIQGGFPQGIYGGGGQGGYYSGGQYPGTPGFDPYWCYRNSQQCVGFQWCGGYGGGQQVIQRPPIYINRPPQYYTRIQYVNRIQYVPQYVTRYVDRVVPKYITRYVQIPIVRPVYYIPKIQCYVRYTTQYGQPIQQQPIYSQQQEQQYQYQPQGCYDQGQGQVGQLPSGCVDGGAGYGAGAGYGYGYGLQSDQQQQTQAPGAAVGGAAEYSVASATGALGSTGGGAQP